MDIKTHVYAVYRNSDMTEGRGPMVLDKLFLYEDDAWNYANQQLGVMGYKPRDGNWRNEEYGEWRVSTLEVY